MTNRVSKRRQFQRKVGSTKTLEPKQFKIVIQDFLVDKSILKSYRKMIDEYFRKKRTSIGRRSSLRISQKENVPVKDSQTSSQKRNGRKFRERKKVTRTSKRETTTVEKSDGKIVEKKKKFDMNEMRNGEINSNDCQKYLDVFQLHYKKKTEMNLTYVQVVVYSDGLVRVLFNSRKENGDTQFLQTKVIEELSEVFQKIFDEVSSRTDRNKEGKKEKNEFRGCRL
ncbi:hypothetical protein SNEBB_003784, partial [Seison nebaliae]